MEFRAIGPDDVDAFFRALAAAFGDAHPDPEEVAADRALLEVDRTFAAFDDGAIVGCAGVFTQEMLVPGGATTPTAGVTMVGVLPTHRRRGVLRALMRLMLDQAIDRGEAVATLFASQGAIYGRFGFAHAAGHLSLNIALDRVAWAVEPPAGSVHLLPREDALPTMHAIYDAAVRQRAGGILQSLEQFAITHRESEKQDEKPFYAIRQDADGRPDAYAMYRMKHRWPRGLPHVELKVERFVAATPDATQAMWRFLCEVDLVSKVTAYARPRDEPLLLMTEEPRALRAELDDGLFVRVLDVPAAWERRTFAADGSVRVAIEDAFRPDSGATFELSAEGGAGACRRVDGEADVSCTVHAIGATYLGGHTWASLVAAGRAIEHTSGAIARLDAMCRTDLAPWPILFF
jgi:predicted acetyltransferase